jgi:lipoprotein NlpD
MNFVFASKLVTALVAALVATGCATNRGGGRAPVEDRGTAASGAAAPGTSTTPAAGTVVTNGAPLKPPAGVENTGKPGYYTVRPGDTLIRIALETGQSWRDIARWNNLDNPNLIEVGQVVRVVQPVAGTIVATAPAAASASASVSASTPTVSPQGSDTGVVTRPVTTSSVNPVTATNNTSAPAPRATPAPAPSAAAASSPASAAGDDEVAFIWPASGSLIAGFDEAKNKGLDIAGKAGDAVLAAADGRVVYSGAGLRGYGNLVIVQHNKTYLTAYAHNQTLLVREDQSVRKGQKIAEMGSSDAERVKLHFEVRRQGKPIDPAKLLPQR